MSADSRLHEVVVDAATRTFQSHKRLADSALAQLTDEQLLVALDANTNSIAVIIKHMAGNMLSRWTDFLSSDGEKPGRKRDQEFVEEHLSRAQLMERWERGWQCLFDALAALKPGDLEKEIRIRNEAQSAVIAIDRQLAHYGYHVGQIVLIARFLAKDKWKSLSIPKGQSEQFNAKMKKD
jgi:hypothetical protein